MSIRLPVVGATSPFLFGHSHAADRTIGVLAELAELVEVRGFLRPETRAFIFIGLLGGFTTFSAFANETVAAARDGAFVLAAVNVAASVGLCLGAVWVGRMAAHMLWG